MDNKQKVFLLEEIRVYYRIIKEIRRGKCAYVTEDKIKYTLGSSVIKALDNSARKEK